MPEKKTLIEITLHGYFCDFKFTEAYKALPKWKRVQVLQKMVDNGEQWLKDENIEKDIKEN